MAELASVCTLKKSWDAQVERIRKEGMQRYLSKCDIPMDAPLLYPEGEDIFTTHGCLRTNAAILLNEACLRNPEMNRFVERMIRRVKKVNDRVHLRGEDEVGKVWLEDCKRMVWASEFPDHFKSRLCNVLTAMYRNRAQIYSRTLNKRASNANGNTRELLLKRLEKEYQETDILFKNLQKRLLGLECNECDNNEASPDVGDDGEVSEADAVNTDTMCDSVLGFLLWFVLIAAFFSMLFCGVDSPVHVHGA